jgi:hypothetical protein
VLLATATNVEAGKIIAAAGIDAVVAQRTKRVVIAVSLTSTAQTIGSER